MNISDLKENDVVHSNWFVNWPVLVCKFQPGLNGLRLVPKNYMDHAETERNRRIACPTVDLLERTDWTLIGSYDPINEEFAWKQFRVDLTRTETGLVWKRDHPNQIFNSFQEAEEEALRWDRFYLKGWIMKMIGSPSGRDAELCKIVRENTTAVWSAEVVPI